MGALFNGASFHTRPTKYTPANENQDVTDMTIIVTGRPQFAGEVRHHPKSRNQVHSASSTHTHTHLNPDMSRANDPKREHAMANVSNHEFEPDHACAFFPRLTSLLVDEELGTDNARYNTIHEVNLELDSRHHLERIISVNASEESPGIPEFTMAVDSRTIVFGGAGPESHYEESHRTME